MMTLIASALLHRDADALRAGVTPVFFGEGAIHTVPLPRQLDWPRVAGPCLGSWGGTGDAIHHRPGLHHLKGLAEEGAIIMVQASGGYL